MKLFAAVLILALAAAGCVSKSTEIARARAAYLAGQSAAARDAETQTNIIVLGDVQNHQVPWTDGMTLARAIVAANYGGLHAPHQIILQRQGQQAEIDPKALLRGGTVQLEPGDVIIVQER